MDYPALNVSDGDFCTMVGPRISWENPFVLRQYPHNVALCNGSPSDELDPERKRARKGLLKLQRLAELAGRTSGAKAGNGVAKRWWCVEK